MELKFRVCVFLVAILLVQIDLLAYDSLRTENRNGELVVIHQVEQGETLYSLSKRYRAELSTISRMNDLQGNNIDLGQILAIPTGKLATETQNVTVDQSDKSQSKTSQTHVVKPKETLYAISKMYDVSVDDLRKWNSLKGNALDIGQELIVGKGEGSAAVTKPVDSSTKKPVVKDKPIGFKEYYVQTGDMLETIAKKFGTRPDSIIIWNELPNTYLAIGQRLLIKGEVDSVVQVTPEKVIKTDYSKTRRVEDQSGFTKIYEEGLAKSIEGVIDTDKYLAMHRTLKVGTMIEVRNLMNNKKIFVRIVGILPDTGLNENTLVRLTPICFERLGVIDPQTRVEISYYED